MSCYLPDFPITFSEMLSVSLTAVEIGRIMADAQLRHIIGNVAPETCTPCDERKERVIDMNSEQIRKFFADYQVVLKRVEQLEAAMRIKSDWDTWCAALRERAEFFRTEYAHMNALMRSVMPEFAKEEPALDDDAWNQLQISMMDFYRRTQIWNSPASCVNHMAHAQGTITARFRFCRGISAQSRSTASIRRLWWPTRTS